MVDQLIACTHIHVHIHLHNSLAQSLSLWLHAPMPADAGSHPIHSEAGGGGGGGGGGGWVRKHGFPFKETLKELHMKHRHLSDHNQLASKKEYIIPYTTKKNRKQAQHRAAKETTEGRNNPHE